MNTSDLNKRMKDYESVSKTKLMKRCPVICRIDGKAFHTFTKGFKRPFDDILIKSMQQTAKYLCQNLQGVIMSYQHSDEISLIFVDYKELNTSPYFDYEVQKLCSVIASMTTMAFNKLFRQNVYHHIYHLLGDCEYELGENYLYAVEKGAMFDARVFNIPKDEVTNNIYWRQSDASRNSVQMVGQANFSHKELQEKSNNEIQDMLMLQKGINWNDFPTYLKRGSCCIKKIINQEIKDEVKEMSFGEPKTTKTITLRSEWVIDKEIPIFKGDGREYIERLINFEE